MEPCTCAVDARRVLTLAGIDPDAHPTPPIDGEGPDVIGTCEHGHAVPALPVEEVR